jgi:cell division protein FtsB
LRSQAGNRSKLWFRIKLALASISVIAFAGWLTFAEGGFIDSSKLAREREAQIERIAQLEARKLKIQEYLDRLEKGDEIAMETAARRYGLVSPTESIYRIKAEPEAKN